MLDKLAEWRYTIDPRTGTWVDKLVMGIAWRMPHWLVYWCSIRMHANATTGAYGYRHPDEVSWSEAAQCWHARIGGDPSFQPREGKS